MAPGFFFVPTSHTVFMWFREPDGKITVTLCNLTREEFNTLQPLVTPSRRV